MQVQVEIVHGEPVRLHHCDSCTMHQVLLVQRHLGGVKFSGAVLLINQGVGNNIQAQGNSQLLSVAGGNGFVDIDRRKECGQRMVAVLAGVTHGEVKIYFSGRFCLSF